MIQKRYKLSLVLLLLLIAISTINSHKAALDDYEEVEIVED